MPSIIRERLINLSKELPMEKYENPLERVLTDARFSPTARIVALYLVVVPDGTKLGSEHIREKLGLGEGAWKNARRQLIDTGYMTHFRKHNSEGRVEWVFEFTDIPQK